jgi:FKBP-type peptidyl-prolyl cis-trans isomerase FkpA
MSKRLLILIFAIVMVACGTKDVPPCPAVTATAPATEVANLRAYIQGNNITATEDPRGFFYRIDNAGTGAKPTPCSGVTVNYVGTLTNGSTFDSGSDVSFSLSRLILGWQEGIPLIGAGGTIYLYLPPSLAYGSSPSGGIPPNSILIFKIDLTAVR